MKQKLSILLILMVLVVILAGLNAVSYVQREKPPDSEMLANRSTYNTGATGTQALFDLLNETGRKAVRWQEPPAALLTAKHTTSPAVFVVIGEVKNEYTSAETEDLFKWVAAGGRLVIIDRDPPKDLASTTANWQITFHDKDALGVMSVDPSDEKQMTSETTAARPVQPAVFTSGVTGVQPSRFASSIDLERLTDDDNQTGKDKRTQPPAPAPGHVPPAKAVDPPETNIKKITSIRSQDVASPSWIAPLVLVAAGTNNLVVQAPYGEGKILYVGDPYIVSNGGIAISDNAKMAIDLLDVKDGTIAFDEYHQGYGAGSNRFLQFFEGTPVVSIFLQAVLLTAFVFFSQSRRFARPVPEPEPDRLSKLEYVSAMAELQERSKAYDLAIENIYNDFRRRAARVFGKDNYTLGYSELAALIAERSGLERRDVSSTLFKCEEIIRGDPTTGKETLELTSKLKLIEDKLGLNRAGRT